MMTHARFWLSSMAIAALVAHIVAQSVDLHATLPIYLDYPVGKWRDRSTASRSLVNTNPVYSSQYSIRVNISPTTYICFQHSPGLVIPTGFSHLEFYVHGGSTGGQQFMIMASVNGSSRTPVSVTRYISSIPANRWVLVRVPLADLGVASGNRLTHIYFVGTSWSTFYLDNICLARSSVSTSTTLTANLNSPQRTLTNLHFGVNVAAWDWDLTTRSRVDKMRQAKVLALRYPGGSASDEYDWRNNRSKRTGQEYNSASNTYHFTQLARELGTQMIFTVNYVSGTPEEARDWVSDVSTIISMDPWTPPRPVYWIIGNECYGPWEYWGIYWYRYDPVVYAEFVRDAIRLMKAVDPTIKVGVVGTWSETDYPISWRSVRNPRTGQWVNGWSAVMLAKLKELGVTPDFYDIHYYPQEKGYEDDATLLHSTRDWADIISSTRQMLRDYLGTAGNNVQIMIMENNSIGPDPGKQTTSLINALYLADSWGQACMAGAASFVWWAWPGDLKYNNNNSPVLYGWRNYGTHGLLPNTNTPIPAFDAFALLRQFASNGDKLVQTSSSHPLVSIYAVKTSNGRPRLMIINKARDLFINASVTLYNASSIGSQPVGYRYGKSEDILSEPPSSISITVNGNSLSLTLPPLSITVVDLTR